MIKYQKGMERKKEELKLSEYKNREKCSEWFSKVEGRGRKEKRNEKTEKSGSFS